MSKQRFFAKSGIYTCICHFFFVTLHANFMRASIYVCKQQRESIELNREKALLITNHLNTKR